MNTRDTLKRQVDLEIITDWIEQGARTLDLGCGRGILLESLREKKQAVVYGVDIDENKILGCVKRGIPAYQGDAEEYLAQFENDSFDWVVFSRTLQELSEPRRTLKEALRVSPRLAIGFINYGYWRNRLSCLLTGNRVRNEVYPRPWEESRASNPLSTADFEAFAVRIGAHVSRREFLAGDWQARARFPKALRCGYALYELRRG